MPWTRGRAEGRQTKHNRRLALFNCWAVKTAEPNPDVCVHFLLFVGRAGQVGAASDKQWNADRGRG